MYYIKDNSTHLNIKKTELRTYSNTKEGITKSKHKPYSISNIDIAEQK